MRRAAGPHDQASAQSTAVRGWLSGSRVRARAREKKWGALETPPRRNRPHSDRDAEGEGYPASRVRGPAPQLSGMASGANNTARQLGIATGIAGLGSIFQSKIESTLTPLVAGMPASSHVHELARAVASGGTGRALRAVPPADRDKVGTPRTTRS